MNSRCHPPSCPSPRSVAGMAHACRCLAVIAASILGGLALNAGASEVGPGPLFNVGYRVLDLKDSKPGQTQPLTVAVWYPTAAQPGLHHYGGPTKGHVAVEGEPLAQGGPYPMLVFSHGYGGGGLSAVFFTEALAARGWIVVCPDHHDRHSAVRIRGAQGGRFDGFGLLRHASEIAATSASARAKFYYRLDEMQLALDGMLASKAFGALIDPQRLALGGHSFGGFTALGLSGAVKERHDPRIQAVLLFSTGTGGRLFTPEELDQVRIPSMLFLGERETDQKRGGETMAALSDKIFRNVAPPKYLLEVKDANHFSFNNRFADSFLASHMSGTPEQFELIRRYAIAFLEKHVARRSDVSADQVLARRDPLLIRYHIEPAPRTFDQAP